MPPESRRRAPGRLLGIFLAEHHADRGPGTFDPEGIVTTSAKCHIFGDK
jgi:hypothetical protein